ncbi:MAG: CARDB domain-containing protein [Anaerolineae bacterium]
MKKLMSIVLVLLVLGSVVGCGARRRAARATAIAPAVSTPRADGVVVFQDDFQDGQPDGWQITTGWYVQQEGDVYYFSSSTQGGAWVSGGGNWSDYEFQAAVRVTAGGAILSYRMTGEGRYLLHFREDGLYLSKEYPRDNYTTLTQTAAPSFNAWHQVAVASYGGHLQVYVDRVLQLDYTDPSPLLQGTVGVSTLEGYQAAVDDVLVTRLMTALPTAAPMALPPTVPPPAAPLPEEGGLPLEEVPLPDEGAPPPPPPPPAAGLPVIDYFRSEPSERAGCYYLHWDLHDASVAYLSNEGVASPDSREVCPEETGIYVYTLRAENDVGSVEETITFEAGGEVGQPDLEIGEVSVWVPAPTEPGTVAIQIEVTNIGNGPAGAFTVRWYPHQASGEVGCSIDVMGLDASVGQILTCPPYPYAGHGEMHWRAVVDEDNEIQNDPKGNNEARGTVHIETGGGQQQQQPDLVIDRIEVNPPSPTGGDPAVVTLWFRNQGNGESGPFQVQWQSGEPPAPNVWCDWDVGSLQPAASDSRNCPYTYSNTGTFTMRAIVDSLNQVSEGDNEGNNILEQPITVAGAEPAGQPDLVIRDLMIVPSNTVQPGQAFAVSFRVQNDGNAPAGPSTARWEMAGTGLSCDCAVPQVGPGGSHRCDCSSLVAPSEPKNYGTRAIANYGNTIPEDNTNNEEGLTLQVRP